jgi:16S rRNA (guanine966-N2)-methyltransferase
VDAVVKTLCIITFLIYFPFPMAGKLRITGGSLRGRLIDVPKAADAGLLRPTPDRVRAAIFSSLSASVKDAKVLDVFAGSGVQAIEAMSREARAATLIEINPESAAVIKSSALRLGVKCDVIVGDAFKEVARLKGLYDLIFVDPPYKVPLTPEFWSALSKLQAADAIVVFRCEKLEDFEVPNGFEVIREREYGGTAVFFLRSAHEAGNISG